MDALEQAIAELTSRPQAWILIGEEFTLGGEYDRDIVVALRRLDPQVAPLWVVKAYRTPTGGVEKHGRHLIARYVPDPRVHMKVPDYKRAGIWGVAMPSPIPTELAGLPSCGPYFEAELLEGPSPDGDQPGPYLPMTWDLVRRLEVAAHALRNHSIDELDARRIARSMSEEQRKEKDVREDFRALVRSERERRLQQSGELIRVPSSCFSGAPVSVSASLLRLRKIAADGASA